MRARPAAARRAVLAGLLLSLGALWLAWMAAAVRSDGDGAQREPTPGEETGWYSVYFTEPGGPDAPGFFGGPDAALAQAIDRASDSVEVAAFELDLWSVRDALIRAHRRGLMVRIVTESDNRGTAEMAALEAVRIPIRGDQSPGLMHHKFVVLDRQEIWTGSMNFTLSGAYRNDNNLIRVRSAGLAERYLREFEEMYAEGRFGALSQRDTLEGELSLEGVVLEALFSPEDGVLERLLELVAAAERSVHFLAFSFTSDALADALLRLARAGIEVQGVMEASEAAGQGSEFERMRAAGVEVRLDGNPDKMHHKVLLIDGRVVVTGSYNFSRSAEQRNDENVLIVFDPQLAAAYEREFQRLFAAAQR